MMKIKFRHISGLLLLMAIIALSQSLNAQEKKSDKTLLMNFGYGYGKVYGDMDERYQFLSQPQLELEYFLDANNISFFVNGTYLFDQNVEENVLEPFIINGEIVGRDRANALISYDVNGYMISGGMAYLIRFKEKKAVHGLKIAASGGYLQHKIRIQDDANTAVQIFEPYRAGFDRLSGGPLINAALAYKYMAVNKKLNFEIGLKNSNGFTVNLRAYNYDTMSYDLDRKFDGITTVYALFSIPFYKSARGEKIYY